MALADLRERMRRPAYVVTLLAAVALGYLAVPAAGTRWVMMHIGGYRGAYTSAYIGTTVALAGALWLALGGFYVVRGVLARDARSGVGELVAATPITSRVYLAAKFASNLAVLASMVAILALTAAVLQFARGESYTLNPLALLGPFVLLTIPVCALTAACALLFDAVPVLRAGLGNIVWFFLWMVLAIGGQSVNAPLGGFGVGPVAASLSRTMRDQGLFFAPGDFTLGLVYVDRPLRTFVWGGLTPGADLVAGRAALVVVAVALALVPAFWFRRFDPALGRYGTRRTADRSLPALSGLLRGAAGPPGGDAEPAKREEAVGTWSSGPASSTASGPSVQLRDLGPVSRRRAFAPVRLVTGELRILVQALSPWWWIGLAVVAVAGLVVPLPAVARGALPLAWIWPVLVWSRLGVQQHEYGVDVLLDAYPRPGSRLVAQWCAGVILSAAAGLTPALRLLVAGDTPGLAAWAAGALFVPSLAFALGEISRTQRMFQVLYLALWYAVVNGIHAVDYMGATRVAGEAAPRAAVWVVVAAVLLGLTLAAHRARRALQA